MHLLNEKELMNVCGGSLSNIFYTFYKFYRIIKIRLLMEKVFID